jgi:hypothetical protein
MNRLSSRPGPFLTVVAGPVIIFNVFWPMGPFAGSFDPAGGRMGVIFEFPELGPSGAPGRDIIAVAISAIVFLPLHCFCFSWDGVKGRLSALKRAI